MRIAGIDLSTFAIDIVKLAPDDPTRPPQWHRFPLAGNDAFDRTRTVRDALPCRTSVYWDDTLAIGIEDPRGHSAGHIYRIQGAILACLPPHLLVHPLIPSAWRKLNGLKGNADKLACATVSDSIRGAGTQDWPQDAHDAHLIARATHALITPTHTEKERP